MAKIPLKLKGDDCEKKPMTVSPLPNDSYRQQYSEYVEHVNNNYDVNILRQRRQHVSLFQV